MAGELEAKNTPRLLHRGIGGGMYARKAYVTREAQGRVSDDQPDAREGQVGRHGVAERSAVPPEAGNAGEEGTQFKTDAQVVRDFEIGKSITRKLFRN